MHVLYITKSLLPKLMFVYVWDLFITNVIISELFRTLLSVTFMMMKRDLMLYKSSRIHTISYSFTIVTFVNLYKNDNFYVINIKINT